MNLKIQESTKVVEEKEEDVVQAVVPAVQAVVPAAAAAAAATAATTTPTTCPWEPQFAPNGHPMMQRCIRAKLVASTVMAPMTLPLMTETKERVVH